MFSGIVREIGSISEISLIGIDGKDLGERNSGGKLGIYSKDFYNSTSLGDSILVNGVCLTAREKKNDLLFFDLASETVRQTTFSKLSEGMKVNLEPSLRLGDSLDGHIVSGHVDTTSVVLLRETQGDTIRFEFKRPSSIAELVVPKGSIAIDGISLTIGEVTKASFSVYIVPYTLGATTLQFLSVGDFVNVEADCFARYAHSACSAYLREFQEKTS